MEFTTVLFYVFSVVLVIAGLRVVTAPNPVQSALFLVLAFFNAAAIWMLLQAEFLAILLVLVYVGAVMVLFLFVVMMLDINLDVLRRDFGRFVPMASLVGALIIVETALILWRGYGATRAPVVGDAVAQAAGALSNTRTVGRLLYTDYLFGFEVAGLILLVAIVAAVALTLRHGKDRKHQQIGKQLAARRADRLRIVRMAVEKDAPDASSAPATPGADTGAGTVR